MAFLQLKAVNADQFFTRLKSVVMNDYAPLWPYAARPLRNDVAASFALRGAEGAHGAWAPLNPRYLVRKFKKYGAQPILVASGAMQEAFMAESAFRYEPRRMTYGPGGKAGEIAFYHQTGFDTRAKHGPVTRRESQARAHGKLAPMTHVPARRIFDWTAQSVRDVSRALAAGYVVICRKMGYRIWQQGMEVSEAPLQKISPGGARQIGREYYSGLMNPGAPIG